ncbi:MAG TPA: class I SAM-dependent methyltransferase [Patescibacteria group bacterium]|nr:class I SAM-dependent methyltransferase [Patescibacteria group bacterium]
MGAEEKVSLKILEELGAKPSISEEHGLALIRDTDLKIFSPGISTAGFAEIRMANGNPDRHIVATTIDQQGLEFANQVIGEVGLQDRIKTKLEDLRDGGYPDDSFDFIYARLVLHYLSTQDLDLVLGKLAKSLKYEGRMFVVVRSEKNMDRTDPNVTYDSATKLTTYPTYRPDGSINAKHTRYFHTPESITSHFGNAGLKVNDLQEYEEQLYGDFMRKEISQTKDHVIEFIATK